MEHDSNGDAYTLYSLRHSYASFQIKKNNISLLALSRQMGSSLKMLDDFYAHITAETHADVLAGWLDE